MYTLDPFVFFKYKYNSSGNCSLHMEINIKILIQSPLISLLYFLLNNQCLITVDPFLLGVWEGENSKPGENTNLEFKALQSLVG